MGLAIIIPNSDFSGSPLGKVTKKITTQEIISEYLTNVGADDSNKGKLIRLYDSLDAIGVLASIDIFPMLGNSLVNKLKGLKQAVYFDSLAIGANASNLDNGIAFDNSISVNSIAGKSKTISTAEGYYAFCRAKRTGTYQGSCLNAITYSNSVFTGIRSVDHSGTREFAFDSNNGSWISEEKISADNFCSVSACITNDKFKSYVNGVNNRVEEKPTPLKDITITNIIGGCPQHPTTVVRTFGGVIEMFAQGVIPTDKVEGVDAIFRAYFE